MHLIAPQLFHRQVTGLAEQDHYRLAALQDLYREPVEAGWLSLHQEPVKARFLSAPGAYKGWMATSEVPGP